MCTLLGDPDDPRVWSGTPAHFLGALRKQHSNVVTIGPVAPRLLKAAQGLSWSTGHILNRKVRWEVEPFVLRRLTRTVERQALRASADVVLLMAWYPLDPSGDVPFVYWGDATISQRMEVAPYWTGLSKRTRRQITTVESRALRSCASVVMPSRWAADDVSATYGVGSVVVPFGANIGDPGPIERIAPRDTVRILSIGVEWHRKGLDRSVAIVDNLTTRGHNVHLDVVGVCPPDQSWHRENITWHGFLNKSDATDLAALDLLYRNAAVFLFPTRNDPFGIVLAEAAAYGLPSVATRVGGVTELITDGETGLLVPPEAQISQWADAVLRAAEPDAYASVATAARAAYEKRWSWDAAAESMLELLTTSGAAASARPHSTR